MHQPLHDAKIIILAAFGSAQSVAATLVLLMYLTHLLADSFCSLEKNRRTFRHCLTFESDTKRCIARESSNSDFGVTTDFPELVAFGV